MNISGTLDVTALGTPAVNLATTENGFLTGSAGDDDLTIDGAQLDALIFGAGTIDFDTGDDVLNLTSTSTFLNAFGVGNDVRILGLETIDASTAVADVSVLLSVQTEDFIVIGSDNNDTLTGGVGDDTISGGIGDDLIRGNVGVDIIDGGTGNDTIELANGDFVSGESIDGGTGTDDLVLTNATTVDFTTGTLANLENLTGSAGDDDVTIEIDVLGQFTTVDLAGGGNDIIRTQINGTYDAVANGVPTVLNTENGFLTGSTGDDDLTISGAQLDSLVFGAGTIDFDNGNDVLNLTSHSASLVTLGAIDSSIQGLEEIDSSASVMFVILDLSGQTEDFILTGSDSAMGDWIFAGAGDDFIFAGDGDDVLNGGDGNDTLRGEFGNDTINGDAGNDGLICLLYTSDAADE